MRWNKWWTIGSVLVILAGAYGGYRWWSGSQQKPLQAALPTTQVRKGNLEVNISGTGNIETAYRETLTSSSSGKIASVKVKEGDLVKKGQVLATFGQNSESTSVESQIRGKQIDLKKKRLDLESMQTQYKEAADDDQRAQLSINIQKQQLDIETEESDIQSLRDEENDSVLEPITAPIDGTLATFNIKVGETVGGQGGSGSSSLGEVVDYKHLQMVVGVDELDISKVKLNQQATVLVEALPDQTFTGKVTAIAQEGTTSNGVSTFDVTVTLDDIAGLKAGMSAEARILVEQKTDALYLPIEAVQSFGGRYFVLLPDASGTAAAGSRGGARAAESSGQPGTGQAGSGQFGRGRGGSAQSGQYGSARSGSAQSGQYGNGNRQYRQFAGLSQSGVKRVEVQVGIHNEDNIEILSGLKEGEAVVVPTMTTSSSTQNRNGAIGIPGVGFLGAGGGFQGGGRFQGGNGGTRNFGGGGTQGGGS
ncbi:efflux RND transporter periplasmic adaptor subunit [Cohnella sp. CFH 77786]|uniref:efflux RND transporter periplasmic adaptor subunit n=1 Tax=Cohnella sp. CFH 77786 TaxID=2662265 RepID=UPI001C60DE9A|nr:efflux RND transporter periplasmic adaptor subunit [Cohnella sp. CFH 77786]